jgi:hypothetical protein
VFVRRRAQTSLNVLCREQGSVERDSNFVEDVASHYIRIKNGSWVSKMSTHEVRRRFESASARSFI